MSRASSALSIIYSGGSANIEPLQSVGGQASTSVQRFVSSQSVSGTLPSGVSFRFAANNPIGVGTLDYTAATNTVGWTPPGVGSERAEYVVSADGQVSIGKTVLGFITLYITYAALPLSDVSVSLTVADVQDSVFTTPATNELASGVTEYLCLYLVNYADVQVESVFLTLGQTTDITEVTLGSDYAPLSTYLTPQATLDLALDANPFTNTGLLRYCPKEAVTETLDMLAPQGGPMFAYAESVFAQDSDGVSVDLPALLSSRYDSTNLLGLVSWGYSLYWPSIPAGRMVSFFLRRVTPAGDVVAAQESVTLNIIVNGA
jgi:hypothetical protein